jgi:F-type H+-transporting ATPase subunit epsilon
MATLRLEIVTPEAKAYSEDVEMVVVPGSEGELGILPQHVPLLTSIKPGELRVTKQGKEIFMAVGEGFVEVTQDRVIVLTDMALEETQIDEVTAQAEFERAQEALRSQRMSDEQYASVEATLEKSIAQLHVKRRKRN